MQNFNTPILIIHSELDFRVPIGEGMQLFTAVQRKGIDSKFLTFPDEGHWVLKPQNSQLWYHTVLDWLDKYSSNRQPRMSKVAPQKHKRVESSSGQLSVGDSSALILRMASALFVPYRG